jgi:hypothetical protein
MVITTNIDVNRMARQLNTGKYAGGRSVTAGGKFAGG